MDVSFNNVLEGTRQYFLGLPKQTGSESSGQPMWASGAPPHEEGTPAQSGAPAPSSRPPSAAAAPPSTPTTLPPPRPPSEPLEPEPHIIHKATVMREAMEKRRDQPELDDDDDPSEALSPPSHIIRKPTPALPSPLSAPAAPSPCPARPPSQQAPETHPEQTIYRPPSNHLQPPSSRPQDHYVTGRPPDPNTASRPPEPYRYHYEEGRNPHGPPSASPQPSTMKSPQQTYGKISSSVPMYTAARIRESPSHSPPVQRYTMPASQPPPPHNDRVPPIHHPAAAPPLQRMTATDSRAAQAYATHHELSSYGRQPTHYDRHATAPPRKYDPQQAYPGYRPQPAQNHRVETHVPAAYKHPAMETLSAHYATRPPERVASSSAHETARLPRVDYNVSRNVDSRSGYHYQSPSTSTTRHPSTSVPVPQSPTLPSRSTYRPTAAPAAAPPAPPARPTYDYLAPTQVQAAPVRSTVKPVIPNQQSRMTVSVTTLVNQMNQTKQKRESPLDLSVKTVKNSADSSTTQDDMVDSASIESKPVSLQPRPISSSRNMPVASAGYASSHKVDFAPDFQSQYRERASHGYNHVVPSSHPPSGHPQVRYNGAFEPPRLAVEPYAVEPRQPTYVDRNKYHAHASKTDYVHRIDLTRPAVEDRIPDSRVRDDRHFIIEERKRPGGPIVSNIPEKVFRHETYAPDSRTERISRSAREQKELMSRPVYSYSSYKHQHEQKMSSSQAVPSPYREPQSHVNHRYPPYPSEAPARLPAEYHNHYLDRHPSSSSRHVIQKVHNHRDIPPHHHHHHHLDHTGVPADKRVLSILRNSLQKNEKQTGYVEPARPARQVPDLIVIDDADDVIEITDEVETVKTNPKTIYNHVSPIPSHSIQMPKAVDSIAREPEHQRFDSLDPKSRSPENDVASRIRTKAELKGLPPPEDSSNRTDSDGDNDRGKLQPKSQKQHLFNQIRKDNLRMESVIKTEQPSAYSVSEVKTEPMNIEEIEKDAIIPIKMENCLEPQPLETPEVAVEDDLDWASTCDSFMEQLKSGSHKKKWRKRVDTENESKTEKPSGCSAPVPTPSDLLPVETTVTEQKIVEVKEEPKTEGLDENRVPELNMVKILEAKDTEVLERQDMKIVNTKDTKIVDTKDTKIVDTNEPNTLETKLPQNVEKTVTESKECKAPERKQLKKADEKASVEKTPKDLNQKEPEPMLPSPPFTIKQEPIDEDELLNQNVPSPSILDIKEHEHEKKSKRKSEKGVDKPVKVKTPTKNKDKIDKKRTSSVTIDIKDEPIKTIIKEEAESTDDDEPLIKSKLLKEKEKEKEHSDRLKYQLLKDLSEKSAYVKLECFDVNNRRSFDASGGMVSTTDRTSISKDKDVPQKGKLTRQASRSKGKSVSTDNKNDKVKEEESSTDSEDDVNIASRLRLRKNIKTEKTEDTKNTSANKTLVKSPKKQDPSSNCSTPIRKPGFGDGSDFHPGWEEELYRYKRSLRMPTRLIAIPRGGSGGPPIVRGSGGLFTRGSTSLPDLDPAPLSPAPSSAPSAATDDLYARRQANIAIDSDLESNSSYSAPNRLHYDSEASTSTVFSLSKGKKKRSSIVDVLIQRVGKKEDGKKKPRDKAKEENTPKVAPIKNTNELLPTPSLGLLKNGSKGVLSAKKEKMMEDIFYLGAFRKETVSAFRNEFINNTDGLIGATEEFAPVILKTRTRTESRVLKQRATIKEVFGDDRPASAPPTSCREENKDEDELIVVKKEKEPEAKPKPTTKSKKIIKDKLRRSSSIRDGLRSNLVKRNDAKGRLLRLKKRNNLMKKSLSNKRIKDLSKQRKDKSPAPDDDKDKERPKEEDSAVPQPEGIKKRFKRLFGRRKFSSGFDYIRKKKKIIRREEGAVKKVRRPAPKPRDPESVHDIQKEIKGWFVNKSIGETPLHRAARLGYTDCVAYCLEKMAADPSSKDNAGFTPLHVAAARGHVRIARLLLQYGANVSAAAQGGIRPLHEASENSHVEMIRLLLSYGADPILGTYAGQTPVELAEGPAGSLLRLHIADVQGHALEPWAFPPPTEIIDPEELGCDPLSSPPPATPPPPPESTIEIQCTEAPLPPFYSLKSTPGQPAEGLWCLLQDITTILQIKSKDSLLKQIHCGSGSPKELLREIRTQEFLERAQCHQLLCAGEKVNVRASKVALVRVTDKLRQLLKVETVLVS